MQTDKALERISNTFSFSMQENLKRRRYGIKSCENVVDKDLAYDIYNLYIRSLEKDACNICEDIFCCTNQLYERINTL